MTGLMVIEPFPPTFITSSRGSDPGNLASRDPKEVWVNGDSGVSTTLTIDLGSVRPVDTVVLGFLRQAAPDATWSITGGVSRSDEMVLQATSPLRVPETAGDYAAVTHGLYYGPVRPLRYLAISIGQPAGAGRLSVGKLGVAAAFAPLLGQEWGFGRQPIDTGKATALPSGGFAVVEGVKKRAVSWTFGDLSVEEADRLEAIAMSVGETGPVFVIEDAARTTGLRARIHYGLLEWRAFERRNRRQTRWELRLVEWV